MVYEHCVPGVSCANNLYGKRTLRALRGTSQEEDPARSPPRNFASLGEDDPPRNFASLGEDDPRESSPQFCESPQPEQLLLKRKYRAAQQRSGENSEQSPSEATEGALENSEQSPSKATATATEGAWMQTNVYVFVFEIVVSLHRSSIVHTAITHCHILYYRGHTLMLISCPTSYVRTAYDLRPRSV